MKRTIQILLLCLPLFGGYDLCCAQQIPNVKGDGVHDDTKGLQALLDSKASVIHLPKPPVCYLISAVLKIHSGQTLIVDRTAVIRLADHAGAHLLTNADHVNGNERITVTGGIWDGNNPTQTMAYHEDRMNKDLPYDPDRFAGVLMHFDRVKQLHISDVTFKDPEGYAFWAGNLFQFTIENVVFDFNLLKGNMDGIHICGNSRHGRIVNIKGTTNDDLIALNADDYPLFELSRGPITDICVDGLWADHAHRAVRLLSCGSPVKRIRVTHIYGTYQNEAIILSNHHVHPDCRSEFEDISLEGIFCTNASEKVRAPHIRIFSPAWVSNLTISDYHRTENASPTDNILIEPGVTVDCLSVMNATLSNQTGGRMTFLHNQGVIKTLNLLNVSLQSREVGQVELLKDSGTIHCAHKTNCSE
jgi:hypothetical protein